MVEFVRVVECVRVVGEKAGSEVTCRRVIIRGFDTPHYGLK